MQVQGKMQGQGGINHGVVVDGDELFADGHGNGIQPCSRTAGEDNAFHDQLPCFNNEQPV